MKRRLLSLLLCSVLTCMHLVGCGNKEGAISDTATEVVTEEQTEAVDVGEIVTEENDTEKLYTISSYGIASNELTDFFNIWLGCQIDGMLGGDTTKIVDLSTMLEHGRVVGSIVANPDLHVVYEYSDDNFKGLKTKTTGIGSAVNLATKNKDSVTYKVMVADLYSNFDEFSYYAGTDAVLSMVVNVVCYVDDEPVYNINNPGLTDNLFAITLENNSSNPEEWLISGVYSLGVEFTNDEITRELFDLSNGIPYAVWENQGDCAKDNGFDVITQLVSENIQEEVTGISGTDADEMLKTYWSMVGEMAKSMAFIKSDEQTAPYLIITSDYGAKLYGYEAGNVVEINMYLSEYDYAEMHLLPDNKIYIYSFSGSREDASQIFEMQNGELVLIDTCNSNWEEWSAKYKIDEGISAYSDIQEAYENMIICE